MSTPGDLSRSLVDAAAEAMAALNPMLIAGDPANYVDDARAAVAAVLETLARSGQVAWAESLQAIADEVKEGAA